MVKKALMEYVADKGCCVINNICIPNKVGDGKFFVVACDEKPEDVKELVWVDFRDKDEIGIWAYDCDPSSIYWFTSSDFYHAEAVGIGVSKEGDIYIWKMF